MGKGGGGGAGLKTERGTQEKVEGQEPRKVTAPLA